MLRNVIVFKQCSSSCRGRLYRADESSDMAGLLLGNGSVAADIMNNGLGNFANKHMGIQGKWDDFYLFLD